MKANMPPKENFIKKTIPPFTNHVIEEHIASGANGHLFRAHADAVDVSLAFKVVPISNLVADADKEAYLDEAKRANRLDHESVVRYIEVVDYVDHISNTPCVVFVCNYVDGPNLNDFLGSAVHRSTVDLAFVNSFLESTLGLLFELQGRGLEHGDLHAGNILIVRSQYDIDGGVGFKVTDFGVRKFINPSQRADDFLNVAIILKRLLDAIDFRHLSGRDRFVFDALRDRFATRYLLDTDPTADNIARKPRAIRDALRHLDEEYMEAQQRASGPRTLATPFDYPNCEQIGDSHLMLQALYSNRLLELTKIEAHTNVVLTGPRGCGKTTVFRALSLEYLTSTDQDRPDGVPYVGVYYRCDDLYFAFPRYTDRKDAIDAPMHFFIVTLLSRLFQQLERWARRHYAEEWDRKVDSVVGQLWEALDWPQPEGPNSNNMSTLNVRLDKERRRARRAYRYGGKESVLEFLGPGAMIDVCRILRLSFVFLKSREFHFYIDDYSWPKISQSLQANLNRLLMVRGPDVFFKISTESPVSFVRHDLDGKKFVEAREFDFINLGVRYITGDADQTSAFINDLFARRFAAASSYPVGTLEELIGSCPRNENARARVIRGSAGTKETNQYRYLYGKEVVCLMCSGDIHHIIRLVSRMVDEFGGAEKLREKVGRGRREGYIIPPSSQHQSIRNEAGAVMESIRTVPEVGPQLADVVANFGKVALSYLKHRDSRNQTGSPPHQATKIEPYEALNLSAEAEHIREELLRYSVFIEDPKGKSRRGNVVPRFFLRRSLIPHFRLTFSQRDSVELENSDIELLLLHPNTFGEKRRERGPDDGSGELFDE